MVTGLRRQLPDDDDEDEEEEEETDQEEDEGEGEKMEIVGVHTKPGVGGVEFDLAREKDHMPSASASPALPLADIFRYMMTGAKPKSGS